MAQGRRMFCTKCTMLSNNLMQSLLLLLILKTTIVIISIIDASLVLQHYHHEVFCFCRCNTIIQVLLKTRFEHSTLLHFAHLPDTVIDSDRVMVSIYLNNSNSNNEVFKRPFSIQPRLRTTNNQTK